MQDNETLGISAYIPAGLLTAKRILATLSLLPLVTNPNIYATAHSFFCTASLSVQAKAINHFPFFSADWDTARSQSYRKSTIGHRNEFLFNVAVMV